MCGSVLPGRKPGAVVSESGHARGPRQWLLWVAAGVVLVVGGVVGALTASAAQSSGSGISSPASASSSTASACPVTSVAEKVVPSVVTIAARGPGGGGTGSGEVIRPGWQRPNLQPNWPASARHTPLPFMQFFLVLRI